jgi:hypothetical protein
MEQRLEVISSWVFGVFGQFVVCKDCVASCHAQVDERADARCVVNVVFGFQSFDCLFVDRAMVGGRNEV